MGEAMDKSIDKISFLQVWYMHLIQSALFMHLQNVDQCLDGSEAALDAIGEKTEKGKAVFEEGSFPPVRIRVPASPQYTAQQPESKEQLTEGLNRVVDVKRIGLRGGYFLEMVDRVEHSIILFDGVCNFCNRTVQFIIKRDRNGYFRFASLQSSVAESLLATRLEGLHLNSIVLIENGQIYTESTAVLRIVKNLDGIWKAAFILLAIPKPFRDPLYRFFAQRRYRWFGRQSSCMVPTKEIRDRFLDINEKGRFMD